MAGDEDENTFVQYGINDKPPLGKSLFLGVQHYLTMVGANIAVPLLLAGAMGMPDAVVPRFVGTFFVVVGNRDTRADDVRQPLPDRAGERRSRCSRPRSRSSAS